MKIFRSRKAAVLGLTFAACSAFGQISPISSRAAMNANDDLTWNQLGSDNAEVTLPQLATSRLGVQVTVSQFNGTVAQIFLTGSNSPTGFAINDVQLGFRNLNKVTLVFDPPVVAVGSDVSFGPLQLIDFSGTIRAYRGDTDLGAFSVSFARSSSSTAPFWGVRDEGGISRVEIERPTCTFCSGTIINQLSIVAPQRVSVDVKPGADKSVLVADSNAKLPFAILSAPGFDASTALDISSLRFGRTGTEASVLSCAGGVDVNYDFLPDLTCQFSVKSGAFVVGDLTAKLKGKLTNGNTIYGTADVIVK